MINVYFIIYIILRLLSLSLFLTDIFYFRRLLLIYICF